jgi:hypothetical protein
VIQPEQEDRQMADPTAVAQLDALVEQIGITGLVAALVVLCHQRAEQTPNQHEMWRNRAKNLCRFDD